jgi:hypothetical protein
VSSPSSRSSPSRTLVRPLARPRLHLGHAPVLARTPRRPPSGLFKPRRTPRTPNPCPSRPEPCAPPPPGTLASATVGPLRSPLPRRREAVQEPRKEVRNPTVSLVVFPAHRSTRESSPEFLRRARSRRRAVRRLRRVIAVRAALDAIPVARAISRCKERLRTSP